MAKKLLIVEDDMFLVGVYKAKFAKSDLTIEIARDGDEAITKLSSFKPDVILLDLVMPRKDGYQFLAEIKAMPAYKKIPIIVASNLGQQTDMDKVQELGVADYIVKSNYSLDQIIAKIHSVIK